ncbi:MAG: hypothetical protein PHE86_02390 [Candidatus Marinimicrobia bacterium]|nr:hypothetical protein [Candidatus Neomarinimicrobiota bacterium]MDD5582925.1 hypothetical protein [Candidatus Neomarinimicrobiota bacterium]
MEQKAYNETWSFIVKWITVILLVVLVLVIIIPWRIWQEEDYYRELCHWKMTNLWNAQRLYHELRKEYNPNLRETLQFIDQVRDSILADSMYVRNQKIFFNNKWIDINIPQYWHEDFDTTFAHAYSAQDTFEEIIYTALVPNEETGLIDTIFLNEDRDRWIYSDSLWEGRIIDTNSELRIERVMKYESYNLVDSLLVCSLVNELYQSELSEDSILTIYCPTRGGVEFKRYYFFTFSDTGHGYIHDGKRSWKK